MWHHSGYVNSIKVFYGDRIPILTLRLSGNMFMTLSFSIWLQMFIVNAEKHIENLLFPYQQLTLCCAENHVVPVICS